MCSVLVTALVTFSCFSHISDKKKLGENELTKQIYGENKQQANLLSITLSTSGIDEFSEDTLSHVPKPHHKQNLRYQSRLDLVKGQAQ